MDIERIAQTTAAWVEAWQRGNAHPATVRAALRALADRAAGDAAALAVVERGRRSLAAVPYGCVWGFEE